jgi:long-chain acyl-CoA synthetase
MSHEGAFQVTNSGDAVAQPVEVGSVSFPAALARAAARRPATAAALRFKLRGRWQTWSWRGLDREVSRIAAGLADAGFAAGDRLLLLGHPSPRQLVLLIAAARAGGAALPVDDAVTDADLDRLLQAERPRFAFAHEQAGIDLLLGHVAAGAISVLLYDDPRGMRGYGDPRLRSYDALRGAAAPRPVGGAERPAKIALEGSTGTLRASDQTLLALEWHPEVLTLLGAWLEVGFVLVLPERHGDWAADRSQSAPTVFFVRAGVLNDLANEALHRLPRPGSWRRRLVERAFDAVRHPNWVRRSLASWLVIRPLRRALGLSRTRSVLVTDDALAAQAYSFIRGLGIDLPGLRRLSSTATSLGAP